LNKVLLTAKIEYYPFDFSRILRPKVFVVAGNISYYRLTVVSIAIDGELWGIGAFLGGDFFPGKRRIFYLSSSVGYLFKSGLPNDQVMFLKSRGIDSDINSNYSPYMLGFGFGWRLFFPKLK
jgi:hypothetical protein